MIVDIWFALFVGAVCVMGLILSSTHVISWITHLDMNRGYCSRKKYPIIKGTFADFKTQMAKYEWYRQNQYPKSYFTPSSDPQYDKFYVHASIFCFNGIGMEFNCFEYFLVQKWLNKNIVTDSMICTSKSWDEIGNDVDHSVVTDTSINDIPK